MERVCKCVCACVLLLVHGNCLSGLHFRTSETAKYCPRNEENVCGRASLEGGGNPGLVPTWQVTTTVAVARRETLKAFPSGLDLGQPMGKSWRLRRNYSVWEWPGAPDVDLAPAETQQTLSGGLLCSGAIGSPGNGEGGQDAVYSSQANRSVEQWLKKMATDAAAMLQSDCIRELLFFPCASFINGLLSSSFMGPQQSQVRAFKMLEPHVPASSLWPHPPCPIILCSFSFR